MLEEDRWKYRSDWQLKTLIEHSAKRDRWDDVEAIGEELRSRKMKRLAKIPS